MLKRRYLNANEQNYFMCIGALIQMLEGERDINGRRSQEIWIEWTKRGIMTKSMAKNIKTACTYLKKFQEEILGELDQREKDKLTKKLNSFTYKILDRYTMDKLERELFDKGKEIVIDMETMLDNLEEVCEVCVGCEKCQKDCKLAKLLEDLNIPYLGEEPNCPYACRLDRLTRADKKRLNKTREEINKKNMFARRKIVEVV